MQDQALVKISYRDCDIDYNVDRKSLASMAAQYGISFDDMKTAMRSYGFTIRKGEIRPPDEAPSYQIILVDTDKIVERVTKTTTPEAIDSTTTQTQA